MKLYHFPGSSSCWKVVIALEELCLDYQLETVDLMNDGQFSPAFLQLNPRGTVPVLVTEDLVLTDSTDILKHLDTLAGDRAPVKLIPGGVQGQKVVKYQQTLDELPLGFLTYGLAFHQHHTKVVRPPYSEADFFEKARAFILTRGDKLAIAAATMGETNETSRLELSRKSGEHKQNLSNYVDEDKFVKVIAMFDKTLDVFENELSSSQSGCWLGGPLMSMADISLGVVLHRLWQLGMDGMYSGGARPHLAVFYQTVKDRNSFRAATGWQENSGERWLDQQDSPDLVKNAKVGLAVAAVLGGIYIVKKIVRR